MLGDVPVICDGALPGEVVRVEQYKQQRRLLTAKAYCIVQASGARVMPQCRYFGECGGCQLQQASYDAQIAYKEKQLKQDLMQYGDVSPEQWMPSLRSSAFNYRRRVRMGVRLLSNGELIIGFHRKSRSYLLDIRSCPVLEPRLQMLLEPLHQVVRQLSIRHRLPQIEMNCGDHVVAFVFRHLLPLSEHDRTLLHEFAQLHELLIFTQAEGPDSITALMQGQEYSLQYSFPRHQIRLSYAPADFIQANAYLNTLLVDAVIEQLDVQEQDVVLDLFCGIGNFSLPLARYAHSVIGVEGHPALVKRAQSNADYNGLRNVEFQQADLNIWSPRAGCNKILIDPPREGAIDVIKRLADDIEMLVYVSCLPRTLARDARYLVQKRGFTLSRVGVADMFPQTKHIEALAVFQRRCT